MSNGYQSYLYGVFVQTLMYGIYVATFFHCLRWLLFDDEGWKLRSSRRIQWPMLITSILLFLLSTTDLALTLKSLVVYENNIRAFYKYNRILDPFESVTLMIVDGVLIHRCWIVFGKSWRIIYLPILLWLGCLACAILRPYYYTVLLRPHNAKIALPRLLRAIYIFLACNIAINIYATSLIVYRIMSVAQGSRVIGRSGRLFSATRIIAESGILYTLTSIVNLIGTPLGPSQPTLEAVADSINFSMAGIAFNLILIRVGQNRNDKDESQVGKQRVTRGTRLSTLQFNAPETMSQDQSLTDVEEGIRKS